MTPAQPALLIKPGRLETVAADQYYLAAALAGFQQDPAVTLTVPGVLHPQRSYFTGLRPGSTRQTGYNLLLFVPDEESEQLPIIPAGFGRIKFIQTVFQKLQFFG